MNELIADQIIKDGMEVLSSKLGVVRTIKFLQLISGGTGDSVKEIEGQTEQMTEEELVAFIEKVKRDRKDLWDKIGIISNRTQ